MVKLYLIFWGVLFGLFILFYKKKYNRHKYNQDLATDILKKINEFSYSGQKINYLRKIDPFVFEELLLNSFLENGYKIKRNKKYTGDGGLDGTIYDEKGRKIIIQAKRYKSYITPTHVNEFKELTLTQNAFMGYFIHTGKTSDNLRLKHENSNIKIIGGTQLIELLQKKIK